jgi:hypothetical protein
MGAAPYGGAAIMEEVRRPVRKCLCIAGCSLCLWAAAPVVDHRTTAAQGHVSNVVSTTADVVASTTSVTVHTIRA